MHEKFISAYGQRARKISTERGKGDIHFEPRERILSVVKVSMPGVRVGRGEVGAGAGSDPGDEGGVVKEGVEPPASSSTGSGVDGSEEQNWPTCNII